MFTLAIAGTFSAPFSETNSRTSSILPDEFDPGSLQCRLYFRYSILRNNPTIFLEINYSTETHPCVIGQLGLGHLKQSSCTTTLRWGD